MPGNSENAALLGVGSDSFIEVISGIGIVFMVLSIRKDPGSSGKLFEI